MITGYKWELYNVQEDPTQSNDLAARMPEKLKQMESIFYLEAKKHDVLPLDNSSLARWNAPRPNLTAGRTVFTYSGVLTGVPNSGAPNILNKSYTITAEVTIPEGGAEGMIVTDGGRFGGYGLFLSKGVAGIRYGKPIFLYNLLDLKRTVWDGPELSRGSTPSSSTSSPMALAWAREGRACSPWTARKWLRIPWNTLPDHVPGRRNLRHRPGHAHRRRDAGISLRCSVQVHRQDRQADLQARTGGYGSTEALVASSHCKPDLEREGLEIEAMKRVLVFAAVSEAATGLALLIVPSLVGRLLLGEGLTGIAIPVARVAGIALIAFGVACWPGTPLVGMLTYSAAVTVYLACVGLAGGLTGILLWPAVVLHAILTALLTRAATSDQEAKT